MNVGNLGINIEVTSGSLDFVQGTEFFGWDCIVLLEVRGSEFAVVGEEGLLVLFES